MSLVLSSLVAATTNAVKGYAGERAKVAAQVSVRREQYAFEREKQATGLVHGLAVERHKSELAERAAERQREAERLRDLERHERDVYPLVEGPGSLRRALSLRSSADGLLPLLVLLGPAQSDDVDSETWRGLRTRVYDDLMRYQGKGLIMTRPVDRSFSGRTRRYTSTTCEVLPR
ncbi:MAG: hypothetical protein ACKVZ6_04550 [Kineosporiaceae bacterium]